MSVNVPQLPDLPTRLRMLQRGATIDLRWLDSCGQRGWDSHADVERWAESVGSVEHRSAGYFFAVTTDAVVIVQSMVEYDEHSVPMVDTPMTIPLAALKALRVLE